MKNIDWIVNPYAAPENRINRELFEQHCIRQEHEIQWELVEGLTLTGASPDTPAGVYTDDIGTWVLVVGAKPEEIPEYLSRCTDTLTALSICCTDARQITFDPLSGLRSLSLCSNPLLDQVYGLEHLEALESLILSQIPMCRLPDSIRTLRNLTNLQLTQMELEELPDWLPELGLSFTHNSETDGIHLYKTGVDGIDMSIFDQSQEAILQWFDERKWARLQDKLSDNAKPLNEVKVVFLGDGGSGKSHILARTLNEGNQTDLFPSVSTPGIIIRDKSYTIGDREIKVHFWDFGGQEILHSMHRMFLTKRTLYVVVVNVREGNHNERARYWLHNLKSFADGAPVLLVLNKMDMNENASVNEKDLRKLYPSLIDTVKLSTLTYSDERFKAEFINVLTEQINRMDFLNLPLTVAGRQVMQKLQTMPNSYIHGGTFRRFCDECGIQGSDFVRRDLLEQFSQLGVSFSCTDSMELEDYVVFRPEWITNAIYIILFNKVETAHNGLVSHETIYRLLSLDDAEKYCRTVATVTYNREEVDYVLRVFRKFRLSFLVEEDMEFLPMLCDANSTVAAAEYENAPDTLEFRMHYEYLPNNVIHRLMVERRKELDHNNVWLTGARFMCGDTGRSAVVKSEGNLIRILVRADKEPRDPQRYLDELKESLERINAIMGLNVLNMELAYTENGITEFFDYYQILMEQEFGGTRLLSKAHKKWIPLTNVLMQSGFLEDEKQKKLVRDIRQACEMLQNDSLYWKATEDQRTGLLARLLQAKGYISLEQYRTGISAGGIQSGELDLDIRLTPGDSWSALEALNLKGSSPSQIEYWNAHLKKLLDNYNDVGRSFLFHVGYVQCAKDKFGKVMSDMYEHIRFYSPRGFELLRRFVTPVQFGTEKEQSQFLRAVKSVYDCGGITMTVYHFFIFIGDVSVHDSPMTRVIPNGVPAQSTQPKDATITTIPDDDQTVLSEYRVVLLGDSEAGKSHILARLKHPDLEHNAFLPDIKNNRRTVFTGDTTPGIDIAQQTYTINDRKVRVNYWDFGDQEILHSLQRLFLTDQALYVVVLNTRNDNQDIQADFWLRYLNTYAPEAPLILVLNKIDQNPSAALSLAMLRRRFRSSNKLFGILRISAKEWDREKFQSGFIDELTARIEQCLTPECNFTTKELLIREQLYQYRKDRQLIKHETFRKLCKDAELTDKTALKNLRNRFNQVGILVCFQTKHQILLDPKWITSAIFKLLGKRASLTKSGILSREDIEDLYLNDPNDKYADEHIEFLLQVMRETKLSFPCPASRLNGNDDESREFIPMLCSREEPPEIAVLETAQNSVELQMHYDYLPPSVLHQLMVDRNQELDVEKAWLTGAVFRNNTCCTAVVRRDNNVLTICVQGDKPAYSTDYLDTLKKHIDEIVNRNFKNTSAREVRIGYQIGSTTEYFNYKRLQNAKALGIQYTANSGDLHERIAVLDILKQEDGSESRNLDLLLKTTLIGCMELQDDQTFWFRGKGLRELEKYMPKMDENARNRQLRRTLGARFIVKDQTQSGESSSGRSPGELDLSIYIEKDIPWSIMEALNITGTDSDSKERWNEHLHRMMERYNKKGLRNLILVSYLNCSEDLLTDVDAHYFKLLQDFTPKGLGCTQTRCQMVHMGTEHPEAIRVSQVDYTGGRGAVSVFHFLVHIPEICEPLTELAAQ